MGPEDDLEPTPPDLDEAYNAGWSAFPGGRMADALRGTKSRPDKPRCPYRRDDRVAFWQMGYSQAEAAFFAA